MCCTDYEKENDENDGCHYRGDIFPEIVVASVWQELGHCLLVFSRLFGEVASKSVKASVEENLDCGSGSLEKSTAYI